MTSKEYLSQLKEKRSEHEEQGFFRKYCDDKKILMFAIPNGGNRSGREGRNFKLEGVRAGVPDLMIPIANEFYHGLFIEMKRRPKTLKSGKMSISHTETSKDQLFWLQELRNQNYEAIVCYGEDEAVEAIESYLGV